MGVERRSTAETFQQTIQHHFHQHRDARQDIDILKPEAWRLRNGVENQFRPVRDTGHALARLVEVPPRVMGLQNGIGISANTNGHTKGLGNAFRGDVIMGRANAARCEDILVSGAQGVERIDNHRLVVRHHPHFRKVDPHAADFLRHGLNIGVARATRKDLIANDQQCCGGAFTHRGEVSRKRNLVQRLKRGPVQPSLPTMKLPPLVPATLIKRYKRFLADVELDSGETLTAHVANPGSMIGLADPGMRVWLSRSDNPKRKLAYSWELLEIGGALVGINTGHPNRLVTEAIEAGAIAELAGYADLRREVKYGKNSRIDILLEGGSDPRPCYVEVKNVHLSRQPPLAEFPDSVTARGTKHLVELGDMVEEGHRAVMLFLVQRTDCTHFSLAADIDSTYAETLETAQKRGVEVLCYGCNITLNEITVAAPLTMTL